MGRGLGRLATIGPPRGCSSEAEHQLPKLRTRVRFSSPAPDKHPGQSHYLLPGSILTTHPNALHRASIARAIYTKGLGSARSGVDGGTHHQARDRGRQVSLGTSAGSHSDAGTPRRSSNDRTLTPSVGPSRLTSCGALSSTSADRHSSSARTPRTGLPQTSRWASADDRDEGPLRRPAQSPDPADLQSGESGVDPTCSDQAVACRHRRQRLAVAGGEGLPAHADDPQYRGPRRPLGAESLQHRGRWRRAQRRATAHRRRGRLRPSDAIDPRDRALILLIAFGPGSRKGEFRAYRRRHIDLLHARIRTEVQEQTTADGLVTSAPKNDSARWTTIPAFVVDELTRHLDTYAQPGQTATSSPDQREARPPRSTGTGA